MNQNPEDQFRAKVMAIINITPDSFFCGSRTMSDSEITQKIESAILHGASILDLGGYSTRPGADDITPLEEFDRLDRAFRIIRSLDTNFPVSVDTFRSEVVERLADKWGQLTVNDISSGELDPLMIPTVGRLGLPYIAMHSRGNPQTMQSLCQYDDITAEVVEFLGRKVEQCTQAGITDLTLDPGFGFAKTVDQNFELLGGLHKLCLLGRPVLAGLSRKSMIWRTLETTPDNALNGTTALNWEALRQGARILRVHDVKEAVEITKIFRIFERNTNTEIR